MRVMGCDLPNVQLHARKRANSNRSKKRYQIYKLHVLTGAREKNFSGPEVASSPPALVTNINDCKGYSGGGGARPNPRTQQKTQQPDE